MNRRRHPYQGCALPTELPQRMPYGVDSEIRTHENLGCSQAPSTARPCPRIDIWQRAPVPTRKPVGSKRLAGAAHPRWGYPLCLAESGGLDPRICTVASLSRRARILSGSLSGKWQRAEYSKPNRSRDRSVFKAVSGPARFTLFYVAPPAGFDPAASCLTNKRSPE